MLEIPPDRLPPDVLQAVIEEFITREGTDYGEANHTLAEKVAQVREQLRRRTCVIVFDQESETTSIIPRP